MTASKEIAMPAKRPAPRLAVLDDAQMNTTQRALMDAIRSGPRGKSIVPRGPFAVWLHAPEFGQLAQALGGHCRYRTAVPPRLSEFAILCTARLWRAQYEWFAHEQPALAAGVKPKTIQELRAGRAPASAAKDERAIYDFILEIYKKRRVSDRTYKRVQGILGDAATVELVGILGYYVMISMTLNVFRMLPPADAKLAFAEPK
jgi:4-carboxymuconolactone decarboxylase